MRRQRTAYLAAGLTSAALVLAPAGAMAASPAPNVRPAGIVPSTWTVMTSPATTTAYNNDLLGVSCPSASFCVAVGQAQPVAAEQPIVESYDGTWSTVAAPSAGASVSNYLDSVSCTGPTFCAAVGIFYPAGLEQPFGEMWDGTAWSIVPMPTPSAGKNVSLSAVSCASRTFCIAAGEGTGGDGSLLEQWNGSSWSIVSDDDVPGTLIEYSGVDCPSTSSCMAVGDNFSGAQVPYAERWNGTSWAATAPITPTGSLQSLFESVSCTSPSFCMVVGYLHATATNGSLVESWNGTAWALQSVPAPAASLGIPFPHAVDCFGPTSCVVVGQVGMGFGSGSSMALTWDGTAWALGTTQNPGTSSGPEDALDGVSCVPNAVCVAAGVEGTAANTTAPMFQSSSTVRPGYYEVASDGGLFAFDAPFYGSMGSKPLNQPIVGMARTPDGGGYWEVASDGGLFAFGDATFYGSMGGKPLNAPIVGMTATPDGGGYWEVASDGGLFAFGDATFYGSMGGKPLNAPIVGMTATPDGGGYWEVASDGGLFAFGDAQFYGSMGGKPLNRPIVGMAATSDGAGYYEVASDGGLFAFGDAVFLGSDAGQRLDKPIVGMAVVPGGGYYEVASDGGLFAFGPRFLGSMGGQPLNAPIVGMTQ
jgi:hypothetical protein